MNINNLMKQAQQMQHKMAALKKEVEVKEFTSSVGGDAVKVTVNGKQEILSITLSPEFIQETEIETIQEMIKTATNKALKDSQDTLQGAMSKITGGLNIPGMF
jgi:DNA-binding YbaB/EbfC family protein